MQENATTEPKVRCNMWTKWSFHELTTEAAEVASLAKKLSKTLYYGGYGRGNYVSFVLPRETRSSLKKAGKRLRLKRKTTIRLFAREIELSLKHDQGFKNPEVVCTKRRIQIKL